MLSSTIGAGNTVGVYYATGSAMAKIFNHKRPEYHQWLVTVASQGSENINNVLQGKVEFGLAQADMLYRATRGLAPWAGKPQQNLRGVLALHSEDLAIVVAGDAGITGVAELKGKRINIGAPGSSDEEYGRRIMENLGIKIDEVTISRYPAATASDLLAEGKIDAYFYTAGHPNLSVWEATSGKRKARLLPLDKSLIDQILVANPPAKAVSITTDYYPGGEPTGDPYRGGQGGALHPRGDA